MSSRDAIQVVARAFAATLVEGRLLDGVDHLYIGFSGGADSTALLLLSHGLAVPVTAVHFNHGLRGPAADADAAWCEAFCRARAIPFRCVALHVPDRQRAGEGNEAAARRCRLAYWEGHVAPGEAVALGHHQDDCLEELLLRLMRGANASGLVGLRFRRCVQGVTFIRPLLDCQRADLRAYLNAQGVTDWREDQSNQDRSIRRNAIRHDILPRLTRLAGSDAGLRAALQGLREDAEYLETLAAEQPVTDDTGAAWRDLPPALLPRVLRRWLAQTLGRDIIPSRAALVRLRDELSREGTTPRLIPLGGELELEIRGDRLRLVPDRVPAVTVHDWRWGPEGELELPETGALLTADVVDGEGVTTADLRVAHDAEWFDLDELPPSLQVRAWQPGDRMVPFGQHTPKKLKDIFVDAGIPSTDRAAIPVVVAAGAIIWIAGVKRAAFGAVQPGATARIVRLALHHRQQKQEQM